MITEVYTTDVRIEYVGDSYYIKVRAGNTLFGKPKYEYVYYECWDFVPSDESRYDGHNTPIYYKYRYSSYESAVRAAKALHKEYLEWECKKELEKQQELVEAKLRKAKKKPERGYFDINLKDV